MKNNDIANDMMDNMDQLIKMGSKFPVRYYRSKLIKIYVMMCICLVGLLSLVFLIVPNDIIKLKYLVPLVICIYLIIAMIISVRFRNLLYMQRYETEYLEYLVKELHTDEPNRKSESTNSNNETYVMEEERRKARQYIYASMINAEREKREFFCVSMKHVRLSYRISIIAALIGLFMVCFAIYGAIANNLSIAIIGVTSGAVTEVVAGLVLWIHNKSVMQFNHYYDASHENEKFLSAINVADMLNEQKREEMYIEIIRKQIEIHSVKEDKDRCNGDGVQMTVKGK